MSRVWGAANRAGPRLTSPQSRHLRTMTRRRVLAAGLAGAASAVLGDIARRSSAAAADPGPAGWIDARVEFSNAADLPVTDVVRAITARLTADGALRHGSAMTALLLDVMRGAAPSLDDELRGRCSGAVGAMLERQPLTDDEFEWRLAGALERLARRAGDADVSAQARDGLLRSLGGDRADIAGPAPKGVMRALPWARRLMREPDRPATRFAAPRETAVAIRLLRWARLAVRPRIALIDAYLTTHAATEDHPFGVRMCAPTVRPGTGESAADFACRLGAISAAAREFSTPIHGFAVVDPWRAAIGLAPDAFDIARHAVFELGFLGLSVPAPPRTELTGAALRRAGRHETEAAGGGLAGDEAAIAMEIARSDALRRQVAQSLEQILAWCAAEGAPLACDRRLTAWTPDRASDHVDGLFWRRALRRHPTLRAAFAEAGGPSADAAARRSRDRFCRALAPAAAALIVADPADADRLATQTAGADRAAAQSGLSGCDRFKGQIHGSDWPFSTALRAETHVDAQTPALELAQAARTATIQWFGLNTDGPPLRRLRRYYSDHRLDPAPLRAALRL